MDIKGTFLRSLLGASTWPSLPLNKIIIPRKMRCISSWPCNHRTAIDHPKSRIKDIAGLPYTHIVHKHPLSRSVCLSLCLSVFPFLCLSLSRPHTHYTLISRPYIHPRSHTHHARQRVRYVRSQIYTDIRQSALAYRGIHVESSPFTIQYLGLKSAHQLNQKFISSKCRIPVSVSS